MATKKSTTKSTTTKRKQPATRRVRSKAVAKAQSFRLVPEEVPFFTVKFTRQTLYWLALCAVVLGFSVWILKLQSDIVAIYDTITATNNAILEAPSPTEVKKK
jgi:hypothetical protein